MATSQLTLFDLDSLPGMACRKNTAKNPTGRTGTRAGYLAHGKAKESPCKECSLANYEYLRKYYDKNPEQISEKKREYYVKNRESTLAGKRQYYKDNRDEILESRKDHYSANRDRKLKYNKMYYVANRDEILEQKKSYHVANRGQRAEYNRKYRKLNPDKRQTIERRRRALKRALPADRYTLEKVTATHGTVCYLCETEVDTDLPNGLPTSPHIDHVHPISREGCPGDVLDNCRIVHARCNLVKGAKLVSELALPLPPPQPMATDLPGPPAPAQ